MARPIGLIRLAGILLPGKQPAPSAVVQAAPVFGSRIRIGVPFWLTDCEKSPARSRAVGMASRLGPAVAWLCDRFCAREEQQRRWSLLWVGALPGARPRSRVRTRGARL